MDPSREDLPRVSVGSVQDWKRLESNYKHAISARLDEQVLSNGLEHEKDALAAHINQYVEQTFKIAQPNLRVNGQNYESLNQNNQNAEPFDEALDRHIWSLADTRLQWHKRIAETRRKVPIDIENAFLELHEQKKAVDVEASIDSQIDEDETRSPDLLPRYIQIEDSLQTTIALGEELDQIIPNQVERADRVRAVAMDVKALKP